MKKKLTRFIIINSIFLIIIILLLIFIDFGFVPGLIFFFPLQILYNTIEYLNHIQKYPLNDLNEYKFNVYQNEFATFDENTQCYYIQIKYNKGIYETYGCDKKMIFDMRYCVFPKNYVRAYFVRNIHFIIIRTKRLSVRYLSKSLRVSKKFKYQNLKIVFTKKNKRKEYWIVKKGKTKLNVIVADICGNIYARQVLMNRHTHCYDKYIPVSEKHYANNKEYHK